MDVLEEGLRVGVLEIGWGSVMFLTHTHTHTKNNMEFYEQLIRSLYFECMFIQNRISSKQQTIWLRHNSTFCNNHLTYASYSSKSRTTVSWESINCCLLAAVAKRLLISRTLNIIESRQPNSSEFISLQCHCTCAEKYHIFALAATKGNGFADC